MSWLELVTAVCGIFMTPNLDKTIANVSESYGVDKYVVLSVVWQKSRCDADAVGAVGELGLMQISPRWHMDRMVRLGARNMFDTEMNVTVGVDLLAELGVMSDPHHALAVYNGGYTKPALSKQYASNVVRRAAVYRMQVENGKLSR